MTELTVGYLLTLSCNYMCLYVLKWWQFEFCWHLVGVEDFAGEGVVLQGAGGTGAAVIQHFSAVLHLLLVLPLQIRRSLHKQHQHGKNKTTGRLWPDCCFHHGTCFYVASVLCVSYREGGVMGAEVVPALVLQLLHHLVHRTLQPRFYGDPRLPQQVQTSLCFHLHRLPARINKNITMVLWMSSTDAHRVYWCVVVGVETAKQTNEMRSGYWSTFKRIPVSFCFILIWQIRSWSHKTRFSCSDCFQLLFAGGLVGFMSGETLIHLLFSSLQFLWFPHCAWDHCQVGKLLVCQAAWVWESSLHSVL